MTPKLSAAERRACRHPIKSDAWISFMEGTRQEPIVYCWNCGSLKRDRESWQYAGREEKLRKRLAHRGKVRARMKVTKKWKV